MHRDTRYFYLVPLTPPVGVSACYSFDARRIDHGRILLSEVQKKDGDQRCSAGHHEKWEACSQGPLLGLRHYCQRYPGCREEGGIIPFKLVLCCKSTECFCSTTPT